MIGSWPFFAVSGFFGGFCEPRANDTNSDKKKGGHPFLWNKIKDQCNQQVNSVEYFNDIFYPKSNIEQ